MPAVVVVSPRLAPRKEGAFFDPAETVPLKGAAYDGAPSRTELERFFFLNDADRALIEPKRQAHNRLGFAVQMTTVRFLGVFLDDPADVPAEVVDYLAEQLGIEDASVLKAYGERENTRLDHVRELRMDGFDVRDEDVARLSPFVRHHINMLGRYSFQLPDLPDLPGGMRPLRDPDAAEEA